ncbi:SCP2 sterol-binding domain-containing protein [Halomarina litorea]|uniref:SCP2 sterol-binding domain-containing protein n=1 Tax=Halomarina litorea TaxID=2961595 RepID=UPI0020C20A22|nr:SCP2 sterol-binding domain-containing protein [Halomarina sp. BCD28]
MTDDTVTRLESALDQSDEKLADDLPNLLESMEGRTEDLVREHPAIFGRLVRRMETMDIAGFVDDHPEVADQFQELLWTGMEVLVRESPEVQESIGEDITVNFRATDCEMDGHLTVDGDEQVITGGAGLLDDPTLEIDGPADVLVGLVTGSVDPIQGFLTQQYQMDGPVQKGTRLAPIMNDLADNIPQSG